MIAIVGSGPSAVAWITDYGFHDEHAIRYALVSGNVIGMTGAIGLLSAGLPAFRKTLAARASVTRRSAAT